MVTLGNIDVLKMWKLQKLFSPNAKLLDQVLEGSEHVIIRDMLQVLDFIFFPQGRNLVFLWSQRTLDCAKSACKGRMLGEDIKGVINYMTKGMSKSEN